MPLPPTLLSRARRRVPADLGRVRVASMVVAAIAASVVTACQARPIVDDQRACPTWKADVAPLLAARCSRCHADAAAEGGYDVSTYLGALGPGTDATRNAIAGDPTSRLLATFDPVAADATHRPLADEVYATLRLWIVECSLPYERGGVHPPGVLDPANPDFHGALLRATAYDFKPCATCHGDDFMGRSGGASSGAGPSCATCHEKGPTGCATCHGDPPSSGAHAAHTAARVIPASARLDCVECHVKPTLYTDAGHVFTSPGVLDPGPAEVTFGARAGLTPEGASRTGPPAWDAAAKTCANVYCHGATYDDPRATSPTPTWAASGPPDRCDGCHGAPPASHGSGRCVDCHAAVIDERGALVDRALHLDGRVTVGGEPVSRPDPTGCGACHGVGDGSDPLRALAGTPRDEAAAVLGAHAAHRDAPRGLAAPIACGACHLAPAALHDAGHVDRPPPAVVCPASPAFMGLALADGARPAWDRESGTCENVYCHGGGQHLAKDTAPGRTPAPRWTGGVQQVTCGGCHGVPPRTIGRNATPHPDSRLDQCATCHPDTVDATGLVLVTGPPGARRSFHVNGVVDTR